MSAITEQITPASLHKLAVLAERLGYRSIDEYVEFSLTESVSDVEQAEKPLYETNSPQELAQAFLAWSNSHPLNGPALTREDVSRESIYEDRW